MTNEARREFFSFAGDPRRIRLLTGSGDVLAWLTLSRRSIGGGWAVDYWVTAQHFVGCVDSPPLREGLARWLFDLTGEVVCDKGDERIRIALTRGVEGRAWKLEGRYGAIVAYWDSGEGVYRGTDGAGRTRFMFRRSRVDGGRLTEGYFEGAESRVEMFLSLLLIQGLEHPNDLHAG